SSLVGSEMCIRDRFQGSYEMRGYTFRKEQFVCSFDADGHFLHLSMR
ncbi:YsaB family lipoprotein, partial [Escherichia coli]